MTATGIFSISAGLAFAVFVFVYKGHHPIEFTLFLVVMALIFIFAGIGFIRSAERGRNV